MNPVRVVVVDDHVLVRGGIRLLLENFGRVAVVAEAKDGQQALKLIAEHHPDMVLSDIAMPGMNGLELTSRIKRDFPEVKVLILSMHIEEEYVSGALQAGACGYLVKDAAVAELEVALEAVLRGDTYLSPRVAKPVVGSYLKRAESEATASGLTPRQVEILRMIAEGRSSKQIAFDLGVSVKTVDTHRAQLMDRLRIHDVAGLVRYAIRIGLITVEGGF
jgi:DNA-binding NarL/FixJ family response regulator